MKKEAIEAILADLKEQSKKQQDLSCLVTDTNGSSSYLNLYEGEWDTDTYDGVLVIKNPGATHFITISKIVSISC